MKYSLSELAHFDRCLFPGNFRDDLVEAGVNELDANMVMFFIINKRREGNNVGIIQVYQEFISIPELTNIFDKVVNDFVNKSNV